MGSESNPLAVAWVRWMWDHGRDGAATSFQRAETVGQSRAG